MFRFLLLIAAVSVSGVASSQPQIGDQAGNMADDVTAGSEVPFRKVVPYCQSSIEFMCDIFVAHLLEDPSYRVVPVADRWEEDFISIELHAHWASSNRLEGNILWWGRSNMEQKGTGAAIVGIPEDPKAYHNFIKIVLAGSGLPDADSPFFSYGR